MLQVALTGNIAAGKSTVARHFQAWGATIIDADALVRELQQPGTEVFRRITQRFGPGILAADGALDRAALRARILEDPEARRALEAIVHPAVAAERGRLIEEAAVRKDAVVVSDIPLLFEAGRPEDFDLVVLVDATPATRRARLIEERGLDADLADRLLAAQDPSGPKRARSHIVIDNDGDQGALRRAAEEAWRRIRAAARSA